MAKKAMLIDISRCIGCNACTSACQEENGLPGDPEDPNTLPAREKKRYNGDERYTKLSDVRWTVLTTHEGKTAKDGSSADEVYVRELCRHCADPACISVCLVDAFYKSPEGAVLYRYNQCIGCRYCMQACPFFVPKYEWVGRNSIYPRVKKCVLCSERISKGDQTACAEACEGVGIGATVFGDFDEIVAEANNRIAEAPDTYVPRIYGLTEVGGTTVLYISHVPFEDLGFQTENRPIKDRRKAMSDEPMPPLTMKALAKVPDVVGVGAVLLGGIWWITNRRHEVHQHEVANHNDSNSHNGGQS